MTAKSFSLGAILGVSTGVLLSEFSELHELVEHMCGGPVFTHSLIRVSEPCKRSLLAQHPWLSDVVPPEFDTPAAALSWVSQQALKLGSSFPVEPMAAGEFEHKNPLAELQEMIGDKPVVVAVKS